MNSELQFVSQNQSPKVIVLPKVRAYFYQFLSIHVWGNLPSSWQRVTSRIYSKLYDMPFSRFIIKPYCKFHYKDKNYLDQFKPPYNKANYQSFQDFFIRQFKILPKVDYKHVWPCEGLLCDLGKVSTMTHSNVKGDKSYIHDIFGLIAEALNPDYFFTNVFLHNKNYHRIHAPINGTISRIQHIKGDLVILRPWIYKKNPSIPAFRNERVNIDIIDENDQTWHLSIVGGPAVGTIELPEQIKLGYKVSALEELSLFYLGSTCCMAAPIAPKTVLKNSLVEVGKIY